MKVLKFEHQDWKEIPEQDNPTWDYINDPLKGKIRRNDYLIVCKVLDYESQCVGEDGYVVIYVPIKGDVIRKGLFWNFENASLFADSLAMEALKP